MNWHDRYIEADEKLERAFAQYLFWERVMMGSAMVLLMLVAIWFLAHTI